MLDAAIEFLQFAVGLTAVLAGYFAPTLVAHKRNHPLAFNIFNLNMFLGWTVVAWIIALVWSFSSFEYDDDAENQGSEE